MLNKIKITTSTQEEPLLNLPNHGHTQEPAFFDIFFLVFLYIPLPNYESVNYIILLFLILDRWNHFSVFLLFWLLLCNIVSLSHIVCSYAHSFSLPCRILLCRYLTIDLFYSCRIFGQFPVWAYEYSCICILGPINTHFCGIYTQEWHCQIVGSTNVQL